MKAKSNNVTGCACCGANVPTWLFRRDGALAPDYHCEDCIRADIGTGCEPCSRVAGFVIEHPGACPVQAGHRLFVSSMVAVLPDGTRVALPRGTVLQDA